MGTIKIELDLPEFEKEIELKVLINKDGVQKCTPPIKVNSNEISKPAWKGMVDAQLPNQNKSNSEVTVDIINSASAVVSQPVPVYGSSRNEISAQNNIPSSMMGTY